MKYPHVYFSPEPPSKLVIYLPALICTFLLFRYRLAPAHQFPVPYEDVYRVAKHFLQKGVLAQYSVDPERIAVSGDSAGGNLAAAVSQQVQKHFCKVSKGALNAQYATSGSLNEKILNKNASWT